METCTQGGSEAPVGDFLSERYKSKFKVYCESLFKSFMEKCGIELQIHAHSLEGQTSL